MRVGLVNGGAPNLCMATAMKSEFLVMFTMGFGVQIISDKAMSFSCFCGTPMSIDWYQFLNLLEVAIAGIERLQLN
jgi:hypothetical protein